MSRRTSSGAERSRIQIFLASPSTPIPFRLYRLSLTSKGKRRKGLLSFESRKSQRGSSSKESKLTSHRIPLLPSLPPSSFALVRFLRLPSRSPPSHLPFPFYPPANSSSSKMDPSPSTSPSMPRLIDTEESTVRVQVPSSPSSSRPSPSPTTLAQQLSSQRTSLPSLSTTPTTLNSTGRFSKIVHSSPLSTNLELTTSSLLSL